MIYEEDVPYVPSFGFVDEGKPVIFNSSSTYVSLGLNMDSFRDVYHIKEGEEWKVELKKL